MLLCKTAREGFCFPGVYCPFQFLPGACPRPVRPALLALQEHCSLFQSAIGGLSGWLEEFKAFPGTHRRFLAAFELSGRQWKPLLCQLLNTADPVSWMECVTTRDCRSLACGPCVLAAASSSRFRPFNWSLREGSCVGTWRTWEVTTGPGPGMSLSLLAQSGGGPTGTAGGRLPPWSPRGPRHPHRCRCPPPRPARPAQTPSVAPKPFASVISFIFCPLTVVMSYTKISWRFP